MKSRHHFTATVSESTYTRLMQEVGKPLYTRNDGRRVFGTPVSYIVDMALRCYFGLPPENTEEDVSDGSEEPQKLTVPSLLPQ